MAKGKVLVAMSGGVDSSVAAALLRNEGYDVVGCFMRLGSPGETLGEGLVAPDHAAECDEAAAETRGGDLKIGHQGCCSINDARDAQLVAAQLDIPFYVLNFKRDFGRIIDYFVGEYNAGRTPNPCVRCNDWLKFGRLAEYARSIDADRIATGHYARIERRDGAAALLRGIDASKDQSYVLFGTSRDAVDHMLLPIGRYRKTEIRQLAGELGLSGVASKADSQEICFVPDMDYAAVVESRSAAGITPGPVRDSSGRVIGEHGGHQRYTVGQRRGLGVAVGEPLYVIEKDAASNTITVGPREALAARGCIASGVNWLIDPPQIGESILCEAQIRYNAAPVPGRVVRMADGQITVMFKDPQHAVAPGQAVVCYDGDRVLGGGWIDRAVKREVG